MKSIFIHKTIGKMRTLKQAADHFFMQGYSTTHFMREIHAHPECYVVLREPYSDCYYPDDEPELLHLIESLGYTRTVYGFAVK